MENSNDFWKENCVIAIWPNGQIESVPKIKGEINHFQPYKRMNKKLGGIMGEIDEETTLVLPNILSKLGFINIYLNIIDEEIKIDSMVIVIFPFEPTKEQLNSLKQLYGVLETVFVGFFEKPNINKELEYKEMNVGLDDLKKFVERKLKELSNNEQAINNSER